MLLTSSVLPKSLIRLLFSKSNNSPNFKKQSKKHEEEKELFFLTFSIMIAGTQKVFKNFGMTFVWVQYGTIQSLSIYDSGTFI